VAVMRLAVVVVVGIGRGGDEALVGVVTRAKVVVEIVQEHRKKVAKTHRTLLQFGGLGNTHRG
jgi:hypothetical protein